MGGVGGVVWTLCLFDETTVALVMPVVRIEEAIAHVESGWFTCPDKIMKWMSASERYQASCFLLLLSSAS